MLSLNMNLVWNIMNLIVLYLLLKKFLFKPVTSIMEKRRQMIEEGFADAEHIRQEALLMKQQYERALQGAKTQSGQILEEARTEAKQEYNRIVQSADTEAGKILKNARETISQEKEKALGEMKSEIADLAMAAAAKIVEEQGSGQAVYDQFLKEAGDMHENRDSH